MIMVGLPFVPVSLLCAASLLAAGDSNESLFRAKILPTLHANCATCHGGAKPAGSLSVVDFDSVLSGGKHGPAITPGSASSSLLIQYVRGERTPKMPMGGSIPEVTVTALTKAIDEMKPLATAAKHGYAEWLFSPPKPPTVPSPSRTDAIANPIDAFILAKLESKRLSLAPSASRRALIRRIYFDLIGLPPTPEEL